MKLLSLMEEKAVKKLLNIESPRLNNLSKSVVINNTNKSMNQSSYALPKSLNQSAVKVVDTKESDKSSVIEDEDENSENIATTIFVGYVILAFTFCFWTIGIYWVLISKFMPDTGYILLDAMKYDETGFMSVVSLIIPLSGFAYPNWYALKMFIHF